MEYDQEECGMKSVFKNYQNFSPPVKDETVKQSHPFVTPYPWAANRVVGFLVQPHEKQSFFAKKELSGAGAVSGESDGGDK